MRRRKSWSSLVETLLTKAENGSRAAYVTTFVLPFMLYNLALDLFIGNSSKSLLNSFCFTISVTNFSQYLWVHRYSSLPCFGLLLDILLNLWVWESYCYATWAVVKVLGVDICPNVGLTVSVDMRGYVDKLAYILHKKSVSFII